jgi:hypothetical protein
MTHKYLSQIRTIPNYYENQSSFAKTWRSISYTFKSASNLLIKNKKTRIITSVLAVYMILTSGFVVAFINVDNSQAKAQILVPVNDLEISLKKQEISSGNITLKLEVQNKTNQTIVNPSFQFKSSFDNVVWISSSNEQNNNKVDAQSASFNLSNISPSQKASYSIYGKVSNLNVSNFAVTTKVSYVSENKALEKDSPKFLIDLK